MLLLLLLSNNNANYPCLTAFIHLINQSIVSFTDTFSFPCFAFQDVCCVLRHSTALSNRTRAQPQQQSTGELHP